MSDGMVISRSLILIGGCCGAGTICKGARARVDASQERDADGEQCLRLQGVGATRKRTQRAARSTARKHDALERRRQYGGQGGADATAEQCLRLQGVGATGSRPTAALRCSTKVAVRTLVACGAKAAHPAKRVCAPSASSMRNAAFHFAMRSDRANEPTFSWPRPSRSRDRRCSCPRSRRARRDDRRPARGFAASSAARVSVTVPAWFGLMRAQLHAPMRTASAMRPALVTRKSSPTICTGCPRRA